MGVKKRANQREKKVSGQLNLKQTKNSGAFYNDKGDMKDNINMYDLKSTDKKSIIISVDMWNKIQRQAYREGLNPILILDFKNYSLKLKVELMEVK